MAYDVNHLLRVGDAKTIYDNLNGRVATKAEQDGSYEQLTAGNAGQLVSNVGITDKVPYNFRTSGGSIDIGDREVDKIIGGTVAWNQIIGAPSMNEGVSISGGTLSKDTVAETFTLTGTVPNAKYNFINWTNGKKIPLTDIYIMSLKISHTGVTPTSVWVKANNTLQSLTKPFTGDGFYFFLGKNQDANLQQGSPILGASFDVGDIGKDYTNTFSQIMLIDITELFGAGIADYVYSLEQANTGAGVAWFRKLFPKDYYAYDAGSLQSVQAAAHKTVGFNAWDEVWEVGGINGSTGQNVTTTGTIRSKNYIPVIPGATYYFKSPVNCWWHSYDASKNYLGVINYGSSFKDATKTLGNNVCFLRFQGNAYGSTYKNDICLNLSWDGERDGEYEPYVKHVYPLDSDLVLHGVPQLDADNRLYYDGDEYASDGTVTRKYGIVDLGTLTWVKAANADIFYTTSLSGVNSASSGVVYKTIGYDFGGISVSNDAAYGFGDKKLSVYNGTDRRVYIRDDSKFSMTTTEFASSLSEVYMLYPLATPTTESADPYQNPQIVNDFGTEEYVDAGVTATPPTRDVAIPVGHETVYQANLRAKLEMAPDSPDGDGDYIVRQANGMNAYVPISFPADELPSAPSEDGAYVLKCTVTGGTATFTWESAT